MPVPAQGAGELASAGPGEQTAGAMQATMLADLEPLMLKYGVDIYAAGHQHQVRVSTFRRIANLWRTKRAICSTSQCSRSKPASRPRRVSPTRPRRSVLMGLRSALQLQSAE